MSAAGAVLGVLLLLAATWTVAAQICLLAGYSFRVLARAFLVAAPVALYLGRPLFAVRLASAPKDRPAMALLGILCLGGAVISLVAIRPDGDDVSYAARAVYFLEHPDEPMDLLLHELVPTGFELKMPLAVALTAEHAYAALAWWLGVPFLHVYHLAVPALMGALLPLVVYWVLCRFAPTTLDAAVGTAAVVAFLCADGRMHHGFGNFAFVRIWQNKAVFMSIVMPFHVGLTVDFLRGPSLRRWIGLALVTVVASGLAYTAFFLLPAQAVALAVAWCWALREGATPLRSVPAYLSSLASIALLALYNLDFGRALAAQLPATPENPSGVVWALLDVCGVGLGLVVLVAAHGFALTALRGWERRFVVAWALVVWAVFLNPWWGPWIAEHVTSRDAYWRLTRVGPFPLLLGLLAISRCRQAALWTSRAKLAFAGVLLLAAGAVNLVPRLHGPLRKVPYYALGAYKLHPFEVEDARAIVEHAPAGPMLAPLRYAGVLPLFSSRHPQMVVRSFQLHMWAKMNGRPELAHTRVRAANYAGGRSGTAYADFVDALRQPLTSVVLDSTMAGSERTLAALRAERFAPAAASARFTLYTRPPHGQGQPAGVADSARR